MIGMRIQDVVMRVRKGTHWPSAGMHQTVLLREQAGDRWLPIRFGPGLAAGDLVALQLMEKSTSSALTYDLLARLMEMGRLTLERVTLGRDERGMYRAVLWVQTQGQLHELEAGPGDALNLALRCQSPVEVDDSLLVQEGFVATNVAEKLEAIYQRGEHQTSELSQSEWRSIIAPNWLSGEPA